MTTKGKEFRLAAKNADVAEMRGLVPVMGRKAVNEVGVAEGVSEQVAATPVGDVDFGKWLIAEGADASASDHFGRLPIHLAAEEGHVDFGKWSKAKGADVNAPWINGWLPMHITARRGHVDFGKWLKAEGAEVNASDHDGGLPMHMAAMGGHVDFGRWLKAEGADVNAIWINGRLPMHLAAEEGHVDFGKWLKAEGAVVSPSDYFGGLPMHLAAEGGHVDFGMWLKAEGADVSSSDHFGRLPMHLAAVGGHVEFGKWLKAEGSDVNASDHDGRLPMHLAAMGGHVIFGKWLKAEGADVSTSDHFGRLPMHLAAEGKHLDFGRWLLPFDSSDSWSTQLLWEEFRLRTTFQPVDGLCTAIASCDTDAVLGWLRNYHLTLSSSDGSGRVACVEIIGLGEAVALPLLSAAVKQTANLAEVKLAYRLDLPFPLLVVASGCVQAFDLVGVHLADDIFYHDGTRLTPLDVALDFHHAAMVVRLLELGASTLLHRTAQDIAELLGRAHASFMVIGRWQSGKTRVVEHLVSFVRKRKFLGFTVRRGSRPLEKKRDALVKSGNDGNATEGFELHHFSVQVNPEAIEIMRQSSSSLAPPLSDSERSGRFPPRSPRTSRRSASGARMEVVSTLYDFGGQDEYRHFHPIFFNTRTVYVVVFNLERLIDAVVYDNNGTVTGTCSGDAALAEVKRECMEWIQSIRPPIWYTNSIAGDDIPRLFLVGTHWDAIHRDRRTNLREACNHLLHDLSDICMETCIQCGSSKHIAAILNEEEDVHNHALNAQGVFKLALHDKASKEEDRDVKRLRVKLVALSLANSSHSLMPQEDARNDFAFALKEAKLEIDKLFKEGKKPKFERVVRRLDSFGVDINDPLFEKTCIYLKDKGDIFYFVMEGGTFAQNTDFIILSPEWLSKCLAMLVHVATGQVKGAEEYFQDGAIHLMDTRHLWTEFISDDVELERLQFFLDLLVHVGVCVEVPKTPSLYVFPLLIRDTWPRDEEARYELSIQRLMMRFTSPTSARRTLFGTLLELLSKAKHEEHLGLHRFYVDRFKDCVIVQADPDPAYQIAAFIVLQERSLYISFGKGAQPFKKCNNGKLGIVKGSLGWNVFTLISKFVGQIYFDDALGHTDNARPVVPANEESGETVVEQESLVDGSIGCSCQDVVLHISCSQCVRSATKDPFYFTFKSLQSFIQCIKSNDLPKSSGAQAKPIRCPHHRAAQSTMSELLTWQSSADVAVKAPEIGERPKLNKRATVHDLAMNDVAKLGGNEAAARFKIYLQSVLENVFHAYKTIASGLFDEKALASNSSASMPLRLLGSAVSFVPLVGNITDTVLKKAADGIEMYKKHQRFNVAKNLSALPSDWQKKVVDQVSFSIAARYGEQLARLATPADIAHNGRFDVWLRGAVVASGTGAALAAKEAYCAAAEGASVADFVDGIGGALIGELAPFASEEGPPPKQAVPFEKSLAEYTGLWLIEALESFDVAAGDILNAPGRLFDHLLASLDSLKAESEPKNGRIASLVRRVKRLVGADKGGVVVYAAARGDAEAFVEWTVHGFLTAPGIETDEGKRFDGLHTKPDLYGYRRGTAEEAAKVGLVEMPK